MSREQRDLARNRDQLDTETVKRRLERLSRDQEELRRELEELARQMPQRDGERQAANQPSESERSPGQRSQQGPAGPAGQQGQQGSSGRKGNRDRPGQNASGGANPSAEPARCRRGDAAGDRRACSSRTRPGPARAPSAPSNASARPNRDCAVRPPTIGGGNWVTCSSRRGNWPTPSAACQRSWSARRDSAAGSDARRQAAADQERLAGRAERLQRQLRELSGQAQEASERDAVGRAARDLESQRVTERMRQAAQGVREGGQPAETASTTTTKREGGPVQTAPREAAAPAREGADIARALDEVASRLDAAREGDRGSAQRLSDELSRARDLRDRLAEVERSLERLSADGQRRPSDGARDRTEGRRGQPTTGAREPAQPGRQGEPAATAGEVADLQRQLAEQLRDTRERVEALSRDNPEMRGPATPEQWQPSVSAPGTEAFKQDFARWESLKTNLLLALEKVERSLTTQLREQETKDRLNAGASDAVPDDYRALVERYYRSLAAPRRQER